ncbi:MAG: TFIIB-type zinc ribbon-containing protein [Infirmifilum sp.]|uniref:TFIIB-type zinc ribbon-containing protein n=1 Tax=Infirmifilum TaxID=2856573 RepID=UPI0023529F29
MRCSECGGLVVFDPRGHYVCTSCGRVIQQGFDDTVRFSEGSQARKAVLKLDPRLKQLNDLVTGRFSTGHAWRILSAVSLDFNLTHETRTRIIEEYEILLRRAAKNGLRIWKKSALLAFLVYFEVKRSRPRTGLREVVKVFRLRGFKLSTGDLIHIIPVVRALGFLHDGWDGELEELLEKVAAIAPREEVRRHVRLILGRIRRFSTGRSRRNVLAAVIAVVLNRLDARLNLYFISKALGIPYSSLRANVALVESLLLETGLEQYVG